MSGTVQRINRETLTILPTGASVPTAVFPPRPDPEEKTSRAIDLARRIIVARKNS